MANLTRYKQKIFANNSNQVGVFGTGTDKVASKNVETLQSADYEDGWSSAIVTSKNYPIWQERDGVDYGFSYQLAYLLQKGIPEWLSTETYYQNDYCRMGNTIYYSLQDNNTNHNPTSSPTYWKAVKTNINDKITNCFLEMPNNVQFTLSSGTLTLKSGSKITAPDGTFTTTTADQTGTLTTDGQYMVFAAVTNGALQLGANYTVSKCGSGSSLPADGSTYRAFYNTTDSKIYRYTANGWVVWEVSLPLAIITVSSGAISSIDQVFQSAGYMGSVIWAGKGIRGLIPNGKNADGTLNNLDQTGDFMILDISVYHSTSRSIRWNNLTISTGVLYYNPDTNYNYSDTSYTTTKNSISLGSFTTNSSGVITGATFVNNAVRLIDYVDFRQNPEYAILKESYINGTSWYRVYSDGWCEQGGETTERDVTVTFLKQFKNTNYTIVGNEIFSSFGQESELAIVKTSASQARIYVDYGGTVSGTGACWQACGYIA